MKNIVISFLLISSFELFASEVIMNSPQYSKELKAFQNPPNPLQKGSPSMAFWDKIGTLKKVFFDKASRIPHEKLPSVKPNMDEFLSPSEHMKFIWFGHSSLLLRMNEKNILIDPVFSDYAFAIDIMVKRFQGPPLTLSELPKIDHILISHNHYDHLDKKTILFFKDQNIEFLTPLGVKQELVDWGVPPDKIHEFDWGDEFEKDGIKYIATPAQHFSGRSLWDRNKTLWASWVIKSSQDNIYYSADSGYAPHGQTFI